MRWVKSEHLWLMLCCLTILWLLWALLMGQPEEHKLIQQKLDARETQVAVLLVAHPTPTPGACLFYYTGRGYGCP